MDTIYLRGIKIETVIGVWEWERHIRQTLMVDIELGTDTRRAGASDDVADTANYQAVAECVIAVARDNNFQLLEALGEAMAAALLSNFDLQRVKIQINKQGAVRGVRDVGIIIERLREDDRSTGA